LDRLRLEQDQRVGHLSKGETGKLLMLLALAQKPDLLVLDEPTDGLDPVVRRDVLTAVLDYVSVAGATVFISSHLVAELPMQSFKDYKEHKMAPDMKRAVLKVGVCCTVLTLWLVPAEMLPFNGYNDSLQRLAPEDQTADAIRRKANAANALLKRLRLVDSLSARLLSSSTGPVVIDLPPEAGPEEWSMLSEAVGRQVDYLGAGAADIIVGVSFVDRGFGNHPDFQHQVTTWADYFSGTVDGRPFCLVSYPFRAVDPTNPRSRSELPASIRRRTDTRASNAGGRPRDVLGPCGFYLVHGSPGPAVRRWLRDDGMARLARTPWTGAYPLAPISNHRGAYGERTRRRQPGAVSLESTVGEGCLAGRLDACRRAVLDPPAFVEQDSYPAILEEESYLELEEWISSEYPGRNEPFGGRERTWMGDLEAEFGGERFGRFWTSDQAVDDAFAAAFGEPIEMWTMRWAQERMGPQKAGPSTDLLSVLLTLVTLLACIGIATATATRRRV
jgi:hypothetical protein